MFLYEKCLFLSILPFISARHRITEQIPQNLCSPSLHEAPQKPTMNDLSTICAKGPMDKPIRLNFARRKKKLNSSGSNNKQQNQNTPNQIKTINQPLVFVKDQHAALGMTTRYADVCKPSYKTSARIFFTHQVARTTIHSHTKVFVLGIKKTPSMQLFRKSSHPNILPSAKQCSWKCSCKHEQLDCIF